jgi:hypothetical protein
MKKIFNKHSKQEDFKVDDLVIKWYARKKDKGKHGKFDHIWMGPFRIVTYHGSNAYILQVLNEDLTGGGSVNGSFLKLYLV